MNKINLFFLNIMVVIMSSAIANAATTNSGKLRSLASNEIQNIDEFMKLREDEGMKKLIEFKLGAFNKSGSMVLCENPRELERAVAFLFYGIPYKVKQMVASGTEAIKVCIAIEKP